MTRIICSIPALLWAPLNVRDYLCPFHVGDGIPHAGVSAVVDEQQPLAAGGPGAQRQRAQDHLDRVDHLADLGVTCLWLMPFYPSPNRDDGYDIAEYEDVHPQYGTLAEAAANRNEVDAVHFGSPEMEALAREKVLQPVASPVWHWCAVPACLQPCFAD